MSVERLVLKTAKDLLIGNKIMYDGKEMLVDSVYKTCSYIKLSLRGFGSKIPLSLKANYSEEFEVFEKSSAPFVEQSLVEILKKRLNEALEVVNSMDEVAKYNHDLVKVFGTDVPKDVFESALKLKFNSIIDKIPKL